MIHINTQKKHITQRRFFLVKRVKAYCLENRSFKFNMGNFICY